MDDVSEISVLGHYQTLINVEKNSLVVTELKSDSTAKHKAVLVVIEQLTKRESTRCVLRIFIRKGF